MAHVHPRRPSRRVLTAALAAGLALAGAGAAPAAAAPTKAELREKIAKQSATLKQVSEDYNEAREQLTANENKIKEIRTRMPALEKQVTGAKADFAKVAASTYKISNLHEASAVLSQPGPDNMMRRLGAIDQLTQRRQAKVNDLTTATHSYAADQQRLATEVARQEIQVRDLGKRKAAIKADLDTFYTLRREVYGTKDSGGGGFTGTVPKVSGQAGAVVRFAYQAIGKPYRFGADGPDGYDCSGLTAAAWRKAGKSLPHNARMQWNNVARLQRGGIAAGDLVFYTDLSHVGIYVGGGKVIHAPTFGEKVKISPIGMMSIYGYGRPR
ncbi:hypothetical protein GCM10010124_34250 [Pilimelia terevasa]|uniref:NlpC/P60 domain-containing protein n=1 Tax=Pilimelia terevasa TaxID=53372 RepID=A0A8J3BT19_9ACTN|nr:C40 family peptidase [Pilimelia terevasa]GGK38572.1 hypothetical protein GCM10010124_34250 [Pilimelia terevasa]